MVDFRQIEFVRAARSPGEFPRDGRPQICFAGRSNVGKSSLLNTLVGRANLARTSKTPGRTREIHFYRVHDRIYFVDLPGYGYAQVSKQMRRQWGRLIEAYLTANDALRLMVVILDIRRDPNEDDLDLIHWLESQALPYALVLTKSDKVSGNVFARQHRRVLESIDTGSRPETDEGSTEGRRVIRFSAKTGQGKRELIRVILESLEQAPPRWRGAARGSS
jgi:GTP-binding protein